MKPIELYVPVVYYAGEKILKFEYAGCWYLISANPPYKPMGSTPYNGLYGKLRLRLKGVPFCRLEVHKRVGTSRVEVQKSAGKIVI